MPCHHALAGALRAYIDAAGIAEDRKGFLFRTSRGHRGIELSEEPITRFDRTKLVKSIISSWTFHSPLDS